MGRIKSHIRAYRNGDTALRNRYHSAWSMLLNFSVAAGKTVIGIVTFSLFIVISGIYSLGIGLAKKMYYTGCGKGRENEKKYFLLMALLLLASSVMYIIYMICLLFSHSQTVYGEITAISIAAISFFELGIAVRGLVKCRKKGNLLLSGLKIVNLSGAFISLVLTQTALLSFTMGSTSADMETAARSNAAIGILMGCVSLALAVYMLTVYNGKKKQDSPEISAGIND